MNRLQIIKKMHEAEERLQTLEGLLKDLNSTYAESVGVDINVQGTIYHRKSDENGEFFAPDKKLLKSYLEAEIKNAQIDVDDLINDLTRGG